MTIDLASLRDRVNDRLRLYSEAKRDLVSEKTAKTLRQKNLNHIHQAVEIVRLVSTSIQQDLHENIEKLVTSCLKSVFPDTDYRIKLRFDRTKKRTGIKPILIHDGHEVEDAQEDESGGVLDVAAILLQLALLMISKPPVERLFVLDEPFKNVSAQYLPNVRQLLLTLSEEFKIQIIQVTHIKQLKIGTILEM